MMYTTRLSLLAMLFLLLALGTSCTRDLAWPAVKRSIHQQFPDVPHLTPDSLAAWLARPAAERPLLIDVRPEEEYRVSHLRGAIRIDPDSPDFSLLDSLDNDTPIVTYCSVGYRSAALAERLIEAGYADVTNLEGSIFAWANAGHPVYRDGRRVKGVHPYNKLWGSLLRRDLHAYPPEAR